MAVYTKIVNFEMHESITEGGTFIQGLAGFLFYRLEAGHHLQCDRSSYLRRDGVCLQVGAEIKHPLPT